MARRGSTQRHSLKRRVGTRTPRKTLLVFCEGDRTEPEYLNALRREPAVRDIAAVDIRFHPGTGGCAPLTLVDMAVEERKRASNEEGEIDEFWCVFDVEWPTNHAHLSRAVAKARDNEVEVAISNPCFELWLILHLENHTAWLNTAAAERRRRQLDGAKGKAIDAQLYMEKRTLARKRSHALARRHEGNGTSFPDDNPSSGMYRLLNSVEPAETSHGQANR